MIKASFALSRNAWALVIIHLPMTSWSTSTGVNCSMSSFTINCPSCGYSSSSGTEEMIGRQVSCPKCSSGFTIDRPDKQSDSTTTGVLLVSCTNCAKEFKIPEKYAGKSASCPSCKGKITVPLVQVKSTSDVEEQPPTDEWQTKYHQLSQKHPHIKLSKTNNAYVDLILQEEFEALLNPATSIPADRTLDARSLLPVELWQWAPQNSAEYGEWQRRVACGSAHYQQQEPSPEEKRLSDLNEKYILAMENDDWDMPLLDDLTTQIDEAERNLVRSAGENNGSSENGLVSPDEALALIALVQQQMQEQQSSEGSYIELSKLRGMRYSEGRGLIQL